MIEIYEFCVRNNIEATVDIHGPLNAIEFRFRDRNTNHNYCFIITKEMKEMIESIRCDWKEHLLSKVAKELKLDMSISDRKIAFITEKVKPDFLVYRCQGCKGTGYEQIGPGIRGITKCTICHGTGKIEVRCHD